MVKGYNNITKMLPLRSNAPHRADTHQLLVVGTPPFGDMVAHNLSENPQHKRVIFAPTLTGEKRPSAHTEAVDFVCFVVSMQSKLSFERFRQSMDAIVAEEQSYFVLGRWALLVLDSSDDARFAFQLEEIVEYAKEQVVPILFVSNSKDYKAMQSASNRVVMMLKRACRENSISPMFAQC